MGKCPYSIKCTYVVRFIVGSAEIVRDRVLDAILEVSRAFCEHTLGRAFDVRSEHTFAMRLVELSSNFIVNTVSEAMTPSTYDDESPLVRGVEGDLENFGMLLLMLIEVP